MKITVGIGIGACAIGMVAYVAIGLSGPNTDLLAIENPTDAQIAEIADMLKHPDLSLRGKVQDRLLELDRRSLPALANLAQTGYPQVRVALTLIIEIAPEAVFDVVDSVQSHDDPVMRATGLNMLQPFAAHTRTTEIWLDALDDADPELREDVVRYLAATPSTERATVAKRLLTLRTDPAAPVREAAVSTLQILTGNDYASQFNVQR